MSRLDPYTELQFAARAAASRRASVAGAALAAERPPFITAIEGLTIPQRAHARMLNALKNICIGWRDAPEDTQPQIAAAVNAICSALDLWPPCDRAPLRTPQRRERYESAVPERYHWMRD